MKAYRKTRKFCFWESFGGIIPVNRMSPSCPRYLEHPELAYMNTFFDMALSVKKGAARQEKIAEEGDTSDAGRTWQKLALTAKIKGLPDTELVYPVKIWVRYSIRTAYRNTGTGFHSGRVGTEVTTRTEDREYTLQTPASAVTDSVTLEYIATTVVRGGIGGAKSELTEEPEIFADVIHIEERAGSRIAPGTFTNSLGMEFVLIPAGSFMMGDAKGETNETPVHRVTIINPYYLGKYEVTQAQWEAVMGNNPSENHHKGPNHPVNWVSWRDAKEFIERLNAKEGHKRYRLPTEAEWEYAARAGTNSAYFFGDSPKELSKYAWYTDNAGRKVHPVGQKAANPWGLYDVYGNVQEWVEDTYARDYYKKSPVTSPEGPKIYGEKVFRGGGCDDLAASCRSGWRFGNSMDRRSGYSPGLRLAPIGFRLALTLE